MMNKEQKRNYIKNMTAQFENSEAVLVTHYQGLNMKQLDVLRKQMREHGIQFKITKNRITKLALQKSKCKDLVNLFTGPTAVVLSKDVISSAKILTKFSKENKNLKILGGFMDGNIGLSIGKKNFSDEKLLKNFNAVFEVLEREKGNNTIKGDLIKNIFLTSSMGVSYKIKLQKNI